MMVQTKCKLNNTELFLKLFHIQNKEIGNNKYYEETTELEKWQSEMNSIIDLAPNVWLHSSVGRASHRYRGGHGFESR